jgi:hypothetical protein
LNHRSLEPLAKLFTEWSGEIRLSAEDFDPLVGVVEKITANLIKLYFPSTLYMADLIPEALKTSNGLS